MNDKRIFILALMIALLVFMFALNNACKKMNEYEAEHGCRYTGFGLCETYN